MKKYKEGEESKNNRVEEPDLSGTYNAADYISWKFEGLFEIIRGKVIKMSPAPSFSHQYLLARINSFLWTFFEKRKCFVIQAPFDVYLGEEKDLENTWNVVQPDLCVICDPSRIDERGCFGPPDFIIEILSPSTRKKDLTLKFDLYEEFKVPEYWTLDIKDKSISRNILDKEGKYQKLKKAKGGDVISPQGFPELKISLQDFFDDIGVEKKARK